MKYMKLLETAPPLKAESLADGYRVLAEFNGTGREKDPAGGSIRHLGLGL